VTLILVTLTIGLFVLAQPVAADDCIRVKGNLFVAANADSTTSGVITQAGKLNGVTHAAFTSVVPSGEDPATLLYTSDFSITTNKGVLKAHNVGSFATTLGIFHEVAQIDPDAGTGVFAGATGVLSIRGTTADGGATFQAAITGNICTN
jgi:hypothetical protein